MEPNPAQFLGTLPFRTVLGAAMVRRTARIAGWTLVGIGALISLAGTVMLVTPGPGFLVLLAGLSVLAIGGALVAIA